MSSFAVSRSRVIDAPASALFPLVNDFRRWRTWSPWEDLDPSMRRDYTGAPSGVGARYAWAGNRKAGTGTMEIVESDPHTRIQVRLAFTKPVKAVNPTVFAFDAAGAGTRVTWTMTGEHRGIGRLVALVMSMDKLVGRDFEKGLDRLAAAVATSAAENDDAASIVAKDDDASASTGGMSHVSESSESMGATGRLRRVSVPPTTSSDGVSATSSHDASTPASDTPTTPTTPSDDTGTRMGTTPAVGGGRVPAHAGTDPVATGHAGAEHAATERTTEHAAPERHPGDIVIGQVGDPEEKIGE